MSIKGIFKRQEEGDGMVHWIWELITIMSCLLLVLCLIALANRNK